MIDFAHKKNIFINTFESFGSIFSFPMQSLSSKEFENDHIELFVDYLRRLFLLLGKLLAESYVYLF